MKGFGRISPFMDELIWSVGLVVSAFAIGGAVALLLIILLRVAFS